MPVPQHILVCGGAGFLGSHLVEGFLARGARITVVDPCVEGTSGSPRHLERAAARIQWVRRRVEALTDREWDELLRPASCLVDAMGFTRHWEGMEHPRLDLELNYLNHLSLMPALRRRPMPVVYLGSRGQYGTLTGRVREDHAMRPRDPQGIHKLAAESLFRVYAEHDGFPCLTIRLGNCYGPRQAVNGRDVGLVGGFIRQLIEGQPVEVYGDPDRRSRQLIYVEDVVEAVCHLAGTQPSGFRAVNLAGPSILLRDLLAALTSLLGGAYDFRPFPDEIKALDCGDGELDQERLRALWPGLEFTALRPALEKTCAYFRKELA